MEHLTHFIANHPYFSTFVAILMIVFIHDVFIQRKHTILHNFPIVGHIRYLLEEVGPEMRQYWVATDKEELPFNRDERRWVYSTAKSQNTTFGFGTNEQMYELGYPIIKHAAFPVLSKEHDLVDGDPTAIPCAKVIGDNHGRKKPYRPPSIINLSAMSYGALGYKAVTALNRGAYLANCFHNTGEGGFTPYHANGADVVLQIGTGYFGMRDADGNFSLEACCELVKKHPQIKMIEIKLSQGAKPGKGGMVPKAKLTKEIADIRQVPLGVDCISPSGHKAFSTVDGLIDFVELIAKHTGLPVGIKSAVGEEFFWKELSVKMRKRNEGPDYIAIDGGEGGTGAAPLTFSDHVALPFQVGFKRVYSVFQREKMADQVVWIGSAKLGFPDRAATAFAMGCDLIYVAREAMFSVGCIQAQRCHTGYCPTGVATNNRWLQAGFDVPIKTQRFANYIKGFRKELLEICHAAGYQHPSQFTGEDIEFSVGANKFANLSEVMGYRKEPSPFTRMRDLEKSG